MDREPGIDTQQSSAPGTLEKFHLGLAADGTTCALVFVDEHHRSIACIASFADLNGFIVSLTRAAAEMAQRRALLLPPDEDEEAALKALAALHAARRAAAGGIATGLSRCVRPFRICRRSRCTRQRDGSIG